MAKASSLMAAPNPLLLSDSDDEENSDVHQRDQAWVNRPLAGVNARDWSRSDFFPQPGECHAIHQVSIFEIVMRRGERPKSLPSGAMTNQ
jgi:hypothetical protein